MNVLLKLTVRVFLIMLTMTGFAQPMDSVFLPDVFIEAIKSKQSVVIENAIIWDDDRYTHYGRPPVPLSAYIKQKLSDDEMELDSMERIKLPQIRIKNSTISRRLIIHGFNVTYLAIEENKGEHMSLENIHIDSMAQINNNQLDIIEIENSSFGISAYWVSNTASRLSLYDCVFNGYVRLGGNEVGSISISSNIFNPTPNSPVYPAGLMYFHIPEKEFWMKVQPEIPLSSYQYFWEPSDKTYGRKVSFNTQLHIKASRDENQSVSIALHDNQFKQDTSTSKVKIEVDHITDLSIENNRFESSLDLSQSVTSDRIWINGNQFLAHVAFNGFVFSETFNHIDWLQLEGFKLISFLGTHSDHYKAENSLELEDRIQYKNLISTYKKLYNIYTDEGDLEGRNGVYEEMKEIESRKLKHIFMNEGGFKNLFAWGLNRLLKIYTAHGTDPALAVLMSSYMILAFAVFYFFFPSDWDTMSKKKLLENFKKLVKRNEHGYFVPFVQLASGVLVSLFNALMLSINAFVTLGFGNIPTKGFGKYICIIQGFLGWFLLSIFTVALINQVLG
ncbi:MAG: two pore domain potassium channel family protein [Cyclobacteriaceae bacterium]